jgi:hypothetical protein
LPRRRTTGSYLTDIITLNRQDAAYKLIKFNLVAHAFAGGMNNNAPSIFGQHPALAGMRASERYDA